MRTVLVGSVSAIHPALLASTGLIPLENPRDRTVHIHAKPEPPRNIIDEQKQKTLRRNRTGRQFSYLKFRRPNIRR